MKPSELLDRPERWTKGAYARYSNGEFCSTNTPGAECFCLIGALVYCEKHSESNALMKAIRQREGWEHCCSIAAFNDSHLTTFADIQAVLKEANL
jgi:hypothetical protein